MVVSRLLPSILLVAAVLLWARPAAAQSPPAEAERRPALWSVELDLGAQLPGTLYNDFIERRQSGADQALSTRWKENSELGLQGRLAFRLKPEAGVGFYFGGMAGRTNTLARFSGAQLPSEEIPRSASFLAFESGLSLKLRDWARGRGLIEYTIGGVLHRQTIDLTPGHRDALAFFEPGPPPEFDWQSRSFTSWGLSLGTSFRIPVSDALSFRTTFRDVILPVNTAELAEQETADIRAFSNENARVVLRPYTAHHMSLTVGIEYTFAWGDPRRDVVRRMPTSEEDMDVGPAVTNAVRLAAQGDTAGAISALEHRVSVEPRDAYAWRELALLKSARAEFDPTVREEALATLERALNMNPGDTELLRSYGRIRGLVQREGRLPVTDTVEPLELSELAAAAEGDGGLRLAWTVRGLTPGEDGVHRYRLEVEVSDAEGRTIPVRGPMEELEPGEEGALVGEGTLDRQPASMGLSLFLPGAEPGIYGVRVDLTDLVTGVREEVSAGFEIPRG